MKEIKAQEKSVKSLLGEKYTVDSYQREYKWGKKQIDDLTDDLLSAFDKNYIVGHEQADVRRYDPYFLGPIIVSNEDERYIVDGQQRLTTITLVLIILLRTNNNEEQKTQLRNLIYSAKFGKKSFNLNVPERNVCLSALYEDKKFDADGESESVRNLIAGHEQIKEKLEDNISKEKILLFVDWLIEKVYLVEIEASSGNDAYEIFETMNDRGLRLTPAEMLKGYILSKIKEKELRNRANTYWKNQVDRLTESGKEEDADAIKSWLRARHAKTQSDFEEIGSRFHRWVRDNKQLLKLQTSKDFYDFITHDFKFYAKWFLYLRRIADKAEPSMERIYYLAQHSFTLQYPILLASLNPDDSKEDIKTKLRVVSTYLDILIQRRIGNWKAIAESTMRGKIFGLIPDIRNKNAKEIADFLAKRLEQDESDYALAPEFKLHGGNRPRIKRILARITDYVEMQSTKDSNYTKYFSHGKAAFQIEHIWHADYAAVCKEESLTGNSFLNQNDFENMRDNIGGLLLLPKKDNASYGARSYAKKREYYQTQNLLAGSLHENCYDAQTGFRQFIEKSGLPFESHPKFQKSDIEKRQSLYRQIADRIWHPDQLHEAANG